MNNPTAKCLYLVKKTSFIFWGRPCLYIIKKNFNYFWGCPCSTGTPPPPPMASSSENVEAPRDEHHDPPPPPNPSEETGGEEVGEGEEGKTLERAQELFDKGSKAIEEGDFVDAVDCLSRSLEIRLGFLPSTRRSYSHSAWFKRFRVWMDCREKKLRTSSVFFWISWWFHVCFRR